MQPLPDPTQTGPVSAKMRVAIYFTPAEDHPLTEVAARWLGRDVYGRDVEAMPLVKSLTESEQRSLTAAPRRYGFHATLKAPFALAKGRTVGALQQATTQAAEALEPARIELALKQIDGFFALVPERPETLLQDLAAEIVRRFEPFRAPLDEADIARRRPEHLDPIERGYLEDWGYPYVFDRFRFHMTLTERVPAEDGGRIRDVLVGIFGRFIGQALTVDRLAIFVEPEPGASFTVQATALLKGTNSGSRS